MMNEMTTEQNVRRKIIHWLLALTVGMGGVILILFITSRYGPGVTGDSVDYLSVADNLKQQRSFTDYAGGIYLYWPPLYPVLLAVSSWLLKVGTFQVGGWINAISFGLLVIMGGLLFSQMYPGKLRWFLLGALLVLTATPLLRLAANIASDPLFIVLVLAYALIGYKYLQTHAWQALLGLALVAGTASLVRWNGITLVVATVILALIAERRDWRRALLRAIWSGALAGLPMAMWVLGRNYQLYGTLIGYGDLNQIKYIDDNLLDAVTKMTHWLLPDLVTRVISPLVLVGIFLIFAILLNRKAGWRSYAGQLFSSKNLPWIVFTALYFPFVMITSIAPDHTTTFDDRYYAPLYLFTLLFLVITGYELVLKSLDRWCPTPLFGVKLSEIILAVILLGWMVYPLYQTAEYAYVAITQGEPSYNFYNTQAYNDSQLVQYLKEDELDPQIPRYSNFAAAAYFFTSHSTLRAPRSPLLVERSLEHLKTEFADWPAGEQAYLIWFPQNSWHHYYPPEELKTVANLERIFKSRDGDVYLVRPK